MAYCLTPDAIATMLANPSPDSSSAFPEIIVQVVDAQNRTQRFMCSVSDGKKKLRALLSQTFAKDTYIDNLSLIRIFGYTINDIPGKAEKYLILSKWEIISAPLEMEINFEVEDCKLLSIISETKAEGPGIILKPKQDFVSKTVAQIIHGQHENQPPAAKMNAMTRRVHPLVSLNPYQGSWTIKVRVTSKGNMRSFKNSRGVGHVFNVELTDQDGTQIQAAMFNEAAKKFFERFELGKVYYISKGQLKLANKQFRTVQNDYEMTLNENSVVEEVMNEESFIPGIQFSFVKIDELGPYVDGKALVDVIGVVQSVSPSMSIRRKIDNENIPKRDIIIADETKKTVVVALWSELATKIGQELLDMTDKAPVVAIKSLKVGGFEGVSLSTLGKSTILINPDIPESKKLRSWYDSEGKETAMATVGSGMSNVSKTGMRSMYSDRVSLSHILSNPSMGDEKPVFFSINVYVSYIKPDQMMSYRACKICNKKVLEAHGSGYWCESCQRNYDECNFRYILNVKVSDWSGEAWISVFNDQAEEMLGCPADVLDAMKSQEGDDNPFQMKLKEATWVPHLFRVSVMQREYMNEKRQRITARNIGPVDFAAESKLLLEEISKITKP